MNTPEWKKYWEHCTENYECFIELKVIITFWSIKIPWIHSKTLWNSFEIAWSKEVQYKKVLIPNTKEVLKFKFNLQTDSYSWDVKFCSVSEFVYRYLRISLLWKYYTMRCSDMTIISRSRHLINLDLMISLCPVGTIASYPGWQCPLQYRNTVMVRYYSIYRISDIALVRKCIYILYQLLI